MQRVVALLKRYLGLDLGLSHVIQFPSHVTQPPSHMVQFPSHVIQSLGHVIHFSASLCVLAVI